MLSKDSSLNQMRQQVDLKVGSLLRRRHHKLCRTFGLALLIVSIFTKNMGTSASAIPPLKTVTNCDTARFMGTWFVIGLKPTFLEKTCSNSVEQYTWVRQDKEKWNHGFGPWSNDIDISFKYNKDAPITSSLGSVPQKAWIQGDNKANSGKWKVSPMWPIKASYLILEVDDANYEYTVIGHPSRSYAWILARQPHMSETTYKMLKDRLVEKHQYDLDGFRDVPQVWTAEERTKRGFSEKEIPDSMLTKDNTEDTK